MHKDDKSKVEQIQTGWGIALGIIYLVVYGILWYLKIKNIWIYVALIVGGLLSSICGGEAVAAFLGVSGISGFLRPVSDLKFRVISYVVSCAVCGFAPPIHNDDTEGTRQCDCILTTSCIYMLVFIVGAVRTDGSKFWYIVAAVIAALFIDYGNRTREGVEEYDRQNAIYQERQKIENEKKRERIKRIANSDYAKATKTSYKEIIQNKGIWGEYVTSTWLSDYTGYMKCLYNVYVPKFSKDIPESANNEYNAAVEIDIILINTNGVFCIEVKNQKAEFTIKDEENDAICRYLNGDMAEKPNPFKQNRGHINALKNYLSKQGIRVSVHGVVVFGPETLGYHITNVRQWVCMYNKIGILFNDIRAKIGDKYSEQQIDSLYNKLFTLQNNQRYKILHDYAIGKRKIKNGEKWG